MDVHKAFYLSDKIVGISILIASGILIGLVVFFGDLIGIGYSYRIVIGIGCLLVSSFIVYWLLLGHELKESSITSYRSRRIYILLSIMFFLVFTASIIIYGQRDDPYIRPLNYFLLISLMAGIISIQSLLLPKGKFYHGFTLFQIIALGLNLACSIYFLFPTLTHNDPHYHQWFTDMILSTGHIVSGEFYSSFPIFHLGIAETSMITNMNYRFTAFFYGVAHIILFPMFIFLISRRLFSRYRDNIGLIIGLLAALFVVVGNQIFIFYYNVKPNGWAMILFLTILYLIYRHSNSSRPYQQTAHIVLILLVSSIIVMTHSIVALVLVLLLFIHWICHRAMDSLSKAKSSKTESIISLGIVATVFTFMIFWWTYGELGIDQFIMRIIRAIAPRDELLQPSTFLETPISEVLFTQIGFLLFISIALLGVLLMLHMSRKQRDTFTFSISGLSILAITVFSLIASMGIIQPRWFMLLQIMLSIPLGAAMLLLGTRFKSGISKSVSIAILVSMLTFIMVVSPPANIDNNSLSPNVIVRAGYTPSEILAGKLYASIGHESIGTDALFSGFMRLSLGSTTVKSIDAGLMEGRFDTSGSLILLRQEIIDNPSSYSPPLSKLYDPLVSLETDGFSRIFHSGSIMGYSFLD
jgi:hypothetical protein